jgi:alkylhydroperoxidase family enzyme
MQATPMPDEAALPSDVAARLRSLPPINIYRLLGNVPPAVIPWADMTRAVYQCTIDPRLRELAICRQAHVAGAAYELHQHRLIARNNGVSEAELDAVTGAAPLDSHDDAAQLACRVAEQLESTATITDRTFEQLYDAFDVRTATELLFIISFYCAVARFSDATRAAIEPNNPLAAAANPTEPPTSRPADAQGHTIHASHDRP